MHHLELIDVCRLFPSGGGLQPTSLTIDEYESFVLMGPSGSGKTTLLRLLTGLEPLDRGDIRYRGESLLERRPHERDMAYVTQRPALFPYLTVGENLAFPEVRDWRRKKSEVRSIILPISDRLQISDWLDRYPTELSAGEQQRVAIGQMIARRSKIWLLDEPFANLDPPLRATFSRELHLLRDEFRATMFLVTHDPNEAMALGQRIGVLEQGRLIQVGTPTELVTHPSSRFVAYCLGRPTINSIDGCIETRPDGATYFRSHDGALEVALPGNSPTGFVTLAIRPEKVYTGSGPEEGLSLGEWEEQRAEPWGASNVITMRRGSLELRHIATAANPSGSKYRCWVFARDVVFFVTATGQLAHPRT